MPFVSGQTYLFPINGNCHLWVIATDPDENGVFVTVSLTSLKGAKDQTVIIRSGEHEFVKWDTCVHYGLAELTNSDRVQGFIDSGEAKLPRPVSQGLLQLIVD